VTVCYPAGSPSEDGHNGLVMVSNTVKLAVVFKEVILRAPKCVKKIYNTLLHTPDTRQVVHAGFMLLL